MINASDILLLYIFMDERIRLNLAKIFYYALQMNILQVGISRKIMEMHSSNLSWHLLGTVNTIWKCMQGQVKKQKKTQWQKEWTNKARTQEDHKDMDDG